MTAAQYRRICRTTMLVALLGLLAITANAGLLIGLALILAFVVGVAFASLYYLEDGVKSSEEAK